MDADIRVFDEVDSTNTVLMHMADEGAKEGTCVVASAQTKGQGRSGRSFYSPSGNLYMSLLLRPNDEKLFSMITVMAGVAAVEAIQEFFGVSCGIKWVNDVIVNDKKAGGIVAQAFNPAGKDRYVILGIGINVYENADIPDEISDVYTSLFGKSPEKRLQKDDLLAAAESIISRFSYYYDNAQISEAIERYRTYCCVMGKSVEYFSGQERFTARVSGISDDGGLILDTGSGMRCYHDGEIRIRQLSKP